MFQTKDDLSSVEADLLLQEDAVLWEVVVQVTPVHQVEDKTQLLRGLEGVRHAHDERAALL